MGGLEQYLHFRDFYTKNKRGAKKEGRKVHAITIIIFNRIYVKLIFYNNNTNNCAKINMCEIDFLDIFGNFEHFDVLA